MANPYGRNHIDEYDGQKGFVFLEDLENDHPDPVEAGQLGDLLINYQVPLVILNACQSGKQVSESESSLASRLMQAGVQMVVGMGYSVTVSAVEVMMESFYAQLFDGHAAADAIRRARLEMFNQKERRAYFNQRIDLEDWMLPVVYQNQDLQLTLREPTSQEQESYLIRDTQRHQAPTISYGFVGRDLDVLEVERRLISDGNILLIRGMGGIGKSTLLHHLGNWWQRTGFVDRVFYYGYDDRAWTRQQIITDIAQGLMDAVEYTRFQSLALDLQQAELVRQLRANPHLLVLDNLESVRGSPASIPNTLQPEEQDTIRGFLAALRGGRTLVLLGSRGPEEWLAQDSFGQNSHELPGLDPEAASTLADLILRRHGAEGYREDPALERLLGFLDGHPLALEVVLANLARQTPSEVLEALEVGDVDSIDTADSEEKSDKTQSILRCIEYSHGNLSPEAQGLLSCLAPFTSVVDTALLPTYSERLKEQPLLVSLPFDRWDEVLGEAVNWGLMSPDAQTSRWLRPQPIFPYFLRSRLSQPDEADFSRAVNKAFREHHAALGGALGQALQSNDPEQTQSAQQMVGLQYANLARALNLALGDKTTIINLAAPLLSYLDFRAAYAQALEIGETVLNGLDDYPAEGANIRSCGNRDLGS
jgi:hypothetical protein